MTDYRAIVLSRLLTILLVCLSARQAYSQRPEPLPDSLVIYWHKAYFAEIANDLDGIIDAYTQVIRHSDGLPKHLRDWYLASGYYGIAMANSLIGDRDAARRSLDSALAHHFWNFEMIRAVASFETVLGKRSVDSICEVWHTIAMKDSRSWPPEPPIYLRPTHMVVGKKYPVVIALHGGNGSYEVFSRRLYDLADKIGSIVVFLPGELRINESTNAWGIDMTQCVTYLNALVDQVAAQPDVDMHDVTMIGFSQGSQVSYAFAFEHPDRVRGVIAFAGFATEILNQPDLDARLQAASKYGLRIAAISGAQDYAQFVSSTRELQARSTLAGLDFSYRLEFGLPHGIPEHASDYVREVWHQMRTAKPSRHFESTKR